MRLLSFDAVEALAEAAADRVAAAVRGRREPTLALPTGRTAVPLYDALAHRHAAGTIDLSRARGFNLDELLLPAGSPASFRAFMERHAWGRTGFDPRRCDIPDSGATDPEAECGRYDRVLAAAGPLDLAILGIGADGHVGYNLPGPPHERTHVVQVPGAVADGLGVPAAERPLRAITMGFGPLRAARRLLLLAIGPAKRRAVRALVDGPADPRWPASLLRDHPEFDVLVTRDAMGEP